MNHEQTQALYNYWNEVRGSRRAPRSLEIRPIAIPALLPNVFILEQLDQQNYRFRLAGTRVCAYTGNELRGHLFSSLWPEDQRSKIDAILQYLCKNATGTVCNIVGKELRGRSADFELMLLPLATATGPLERILGVLSPISPPYWVGQWRIIIWQLNSARIVRPDRKPPSMKMKDLLDTSHSLDPPIHSPLSTAA